MSSARERIEIGVETAIATVTTLGAAGIDLDRRRWSRDAPRVTTSSGAGDPRNRRRSRYEPDRSTTACASGDEAIEIAS
jgi:hypothetical protein